MSELERSITIFDDVTNDNDITLFRRAVINYYDSNTTQLHVRMSLHCNGVTDGVELSRYIYSSTDLHTAELMVDYMVGRCQEVLLAEFPQYEDVILSKKREPL